MKAARESVKLNLKWNCRVCLEQSENMVSIFETESKDDCQILANKIADCAGIEIDRDNELYPDKICSKCMSYLNVAEKFRTCCRNTDNLLKSLLYDSKVVVLTPTPDEKTNENPRSPDEIIQTEVHEQDDNIQSCVKVEVAEQDEESNPDFFEDIAEFYGLEQDIKENTEMPMKKDKNKKQKNKQNKKTKPQRKETILSINGLEQEMNVDDDGDDDNYNDNQVKQDNNDSEEEYVDDANDIDYVPPIGYDNNYGSADNNSSNINFKGPIKKKFKVLVKSLSSLTSPPNKSNNTISKIPKKKSTKKQISIDIDGTPVLQIKDEEPSVFMCEICGNKYKKKSLLEGHVRWHNAKKEHICEVCGRAFTVNSQLTRHMRVHTGDRPYACKFCDRRFGDYSTCIKHQRTHTGERPFKCDICGKAFMYSNVLKVHLTTHTGEKPFACDKCGKKFAQKHHLKAHMETISYQNNSCRSSSN